MLKDTGRKKPIASRVGFDDIVFEISKKKKKIEGKVNKKWLKNINAEKDYAPDRVAEIIDEMNKLIGDIDNPRAKKHIKGKAVCDDRDTYNEEIGKQLVRDKIETKYHLQMMEKYKKMLDLLNDVAFWIGERIGEHFALTILPVNRINNSQADNSQVEKDEENESN